MKLKIRHVTHYEYEPPALGIVMRLRLFPTSYATQTPLDWRVTADGETINATFKDGTCVSEGLFTRHAPVEPPTQSLDIIAEGTIARTEDAGVIKGLKERTPPQVFLRPTPLTEPDEALRALAETARRADPLDALHALSAAVRDAIDYRSGSTGMATGAAEALAAGAGVCQDHANAFVSAARHLGLPARYVAGYYHAGEDDPEGMSTQTHGWAEGYVDGLGWVGFDIANRTCTTVAHVRVAVGADAGKNAIASGIVAGGSTETLSTSVAIAEASSQEQQ